MTFHKFFIKSQSKSQGLVEFALVLPILLLVLYGTLEVGRLVFTYSTVVTAARQAARYGSANGLTNGAPQYKDCPGIQAAAHNVDFMGVISGIQIAYDPVMEPDPNFTILSCSSTMVDINTGGAIKVSVSAQWTPIVPIVPLQPFTITSSSYRTIIGSVDVADNSHPPQPPNPNPNPPVISKIFLTNPIHVGASTTLYFSITNPNPSTNLTGVAFTDTFPVGMILATNPDPSQCNGIITGSAGSASVSLSNGSLGPGAICSVTVVVTVPMAGTYANSTTVTSTNGGTGNIASASLQVGNAVVVSPPVALKQFLPGSILSGATSTLSITITNPNQHDALTGVGFTDNFPAGAPSGSMTLASVPALSSTCGGTILTTSSSISLSNGTVGKNTSCVVQVNVTGTTGTFLNSVEVNSTNGGSGAPASDTLTIQPPAPAMTVSKSFTPYTIGVGQTSTITFFITNLSITVPISGISFTDSLPSGVTIVGTPVVSQCGGTVAKIGNGFKLSGGSLIAGLFTTCTVTIPVTSTTVGTYQNPTGTVSGTTINGSVSADWTAKDLVVQSTPPAPLCTFSNVSLVYDNGPKTVTWTINNTSTSSPTIDRLVVFWDGGNMQRTDLDSVILWSGNRTPTTMSILGNGRTLTPGQHSFVFSFPAPDTIFHKNFNATLYFVEGNCPILTTGSWYVH